MNLTDWVKNQLKQRRWSRRELARQSGLSHALISRVLNGHIAPTANFCYRVARAFDVPPEDLMRMANLSAPLPDYDNWLLDEILEESKHLSEDKRQQVLDFIRFLKRKR